MITLISAASYDNNSGLLGIGNNGSIPWHIPEDINNFKKITEGNVVIMGRKTFNSLGDKPLSNRVNIVLSQDKIQVIGSKTLMLVNNFEILNSIINEYVKQNKKIFIIGGQSLYNYYINRCDEILLTHIHKKYDCDTYFPEISSSFTIKSYEAHKNFTFITFINQTASKSADNIYNSFVKRVLQSGLQRTDRTGVGTISLFGGQMKFDISETCPILTCKKVAWKSCIKELLWFLRGETDAKILQKQGVHIWDGNSSREFLDNRGLSHYQEGECGKIYGWQIRHSGGDFENRSGGVDQLAYIEELLEKDPFSRRILWNLWIPSDLNDMSLTCCHYSLQLYVTQENQQKFLSALVNIRSNDLFLGNPFNIFSYYVFIRILCIKHNMKPKELIFNIGDAHIYKNHLNQVEEQLKREARSPPILEINKDIIYKNWEEISIDDFNLIGYFHDKPIKGEMAI